MKQPLAGKLFARVSFILVLIGHFIQMFLEQKE